MRQRADIIKCSLKHLEKVAEIEKECIPDGWSQKAFEDWFANENTVLLAAVSDGETIGFANGSWVLDEGELLNIAVTESHRHEGIAQILYDRLEETFNQKGVAVIYLEVREKNAPAISFYEKNGFKKNGFRKKYYRNPDDNGVLMMKKLK